MPRLAFIGSATLIALACAALPACGQQQDETQKIIAGCSDPPPSQIDSCLEQVRVQQETDPSPELDNLLAHLIRRQVEASNPPPAPPPPPPEDDGAGNDAVAPPPSPDLSDGGVDQPPVMSPQDEAPPEEQGNPADAGDDEATGPPVALPGSGAGPIDSSPLPPPNTQTPPPDGTPGTGDGPHA